MVAAEVRNLAQRSASSAKEIKTLIEDSIVRVGSGVTKIGQVNATLTEIVCGIRDLAGNGLRQAAGPLMKFGGRVQRAFRHPCYFA